MQELSGTWGVLHFLVSSLALCDVCVCAPLHTGHIPTHVELGSRQERTVCVAQCWLSFGDRPQPLKAFSLISAAIELSVRRWQRDQKSECARRTRDSCTQTKVGTKNCTKFVSSRGLKLARARSEDRSANDCCEEAMMTSVVSIWIVIIQVSHPNSQSAIRFANFKHRPCWHTSSLPWY